MITLQVGSKIANASELKCPQTLQLIDGEIIIKGERWRHLAEVSKRETVERRT